MISRLHVAFVVISAFLANTCLAGLSKVVDCNNKFQYTSSDKTTKHTMVLRGYTLQDNTPAYLESVGQEKSLRKDEQIENNVIVTVQAIKITESSKKCLIGRLAFIINTSNASYLRYDHPFIQRVTPVYSEAEVATIRLSSLSAGASFAPSSNHSDIPSYSVSGDEDTLQNVVGANQGSNNKRSVWITVKIDPSSDDSRKISYLGINFMLLESLEF